MHVRSKAIDSRGTLNRFKSLNIFVLVFFRFFGEFC
jgi:hypothetical protein